MHQSACQERWLVSSPGAASGRVPEMPKMALGLCRMPSLIATYISFLGWPLLATSPGSDAWKQLSVVVGDREEESCRLAWRGAAPQVW